MEMLLQTLVVVVLVAGSTVIAAWKLMPARTKLRALDALEPSAGGWLSRLRQGVADELAQGCSACSKSSTHIKKHAGG